MSRTGLLALGGVGEAMGGLRVGFGGMDGVDRLMGEVTGLVDDFEKDETREDTGDSGPRSGVDGWVAWICSVSIVTVFVWPAEILSECLESDVLRGITGGSEMAAMAALCFERMSCA